jgi:hypothetical protein
MPQNTIIEVEYINGDYGFYDPVVFVTSMPYGESLLTEGRLILSDIETDGLWLGYWRYEPTQGGMPYGLDAYQTPASRIQLVAPAELQQVASVKRGGRDVLFRLGNDLVNVAKLNRLAQIYTAPDTIAGGYYEVIADLYNRIEPELRVRLGKDEDKEPEDVDEKNVQLAAASELGIPCELLEQALDWMPPLSVAEGEGLFSALNAALEGGGDKKDD